MPPKTPQQAVYPMAYLNMARDYADAANELFMVADARPKIQGRYLPLSSPLYFLYSHAAELALKAFLGAKNIPVPKKHGLARFYGDSRRLGLKIDQRFEIETLMSFLDSGNKEHGFRYFNLEPCTIDDGGVMHTRMGFTADLLWVREVIPELIRAVAPHVPDTPAPGKAAKMTLTVSKPMLKSGVRPKTDGA